MVLDLGIGVLKGVANALTTSITANNNKKSIEKTQQELEDWYNVESEKKYLDSGEGKSTLAVLNSAKEQAEENNRNNSVRTGATAEAQVAHAASINKQYSDAVNKLATVGLSKKEELEETYNKQKAELESQWQKEDADSKKTFWDYWN